MYRYEIINRLIKQNNYESYLEIGVWTGDCFRQVNCKHKKGVDPMAVTSVAYRMESDEYFENNTEKFDIIFVDGLHTKEQAYRDVINGLERLKEGGTILMHDCYPETEKSQKVPRESDVWNGDVWKSFVKIRQERDDLEMYVINTDHGVGVIQKTDEKKEILSDSIKITYKELKKNAKEWLNLISVEDFEKNTHIEEENIPTKRVQRFLHSGNLGDVVWSLPFIISQGGGDLYIRNYNRVSVVNVQFDALYRLLVSQPYLRRVIHYPLEYGGKDIIFEGEDVGRIRNPEKVKYKKDIELDFDLDYFRMSPNLHNSHLISSYFEVNKVKMDKLPMPYLIIKDDFDFGNKSLNKTIDIPDHKYNVFHITERYECGYDWESLIKKQEYKNYFVGLKSEYDIVLENFDVSNELIHLCPTDMYDLALLIKNSEALYSNPSVAHTIAVGINKTHYLVPHPDQKNVVSGLPTENILSPK